jgi:tRNA A-37 threonylcarbamoyl transferase component Bud32
MREVLRNPYLNRVAIKDPAHFFGRRREVAKIFSRIGASRPQSISIVGDRRIGKSSLLYFISHPQTRNRFLDNPGSYLFVLIDLQQKRRLTLGEFFGELFALLAKETGDNSIAELEPAFDSLLATLEKFRRQQRKLIVLLDEFDAITANRAFDLEFYSFLRSIANNYDVAYITSSARDLHDLCRTQLIADSPFFNIFTNVFLRAFTPGEAMELITKPSAEANLPLAGYARRIMEIAGHFPYFLQIACSAYFDHLWENEGKLNREEVEAAFLDEAKGQFRFIWDHMSESARECIRDFLASGKVEKELEHIYQDLKRAGYFIEDERGPRIFSTLFQAVVSRRRFITSALSDTDRAAMAIGEYGGERVLPPLLEPEGYIGRFNIRRSLGAGGMGEIFEAYDTKLHRTVAIKVLAPKYTEDEAMKQRFLREARMASQLNHPNIATIYEIGEAAGNPYIVMEYVEGETLSSYLEAGPLAFNLIIEIGRQTAEALAEAHERGVVHRDIKPSNIMITRRGKVKVLDFGLAKPAPSIDASERLKKNLTQPGVLLGTINYMSPEQALGQTEVTHLSDIFSLGVVLYEALTGRLPFDRDTYFQTLEAITKRAPEPIRRHRKDAPDELVSIITRMLEKSPDRRYQSAAEVARALAEIGNRINDSAHA